MHKRVSKITNKSVNYLDISEGKFKEKLIEEGWDEYLADFMIDLLKIIRTGKESTFNLKTENLLKRELLTF